MARGANTTCDACGEVIFGRKGIAWIETDYLSFKGTFTMQLPKESDYIYVTNNPTDEHHFCNVTCLSNFITFKRQMHEGRRHTKNLSDLKEKKFREDTFQSPRPASPPGN